MANYIVATVGVMAALSSAQVRAAEQIVLDSAVQDTDNLEFRLEGAPTFRDDEFIHTPTYRSSITRPENPQYRVPRTLEKGNHTMVTHPGREHAMRLYGKDNRN